MSLPEIYDAIEIDSPKIVKILTALHPDFGRFTYEQLHEKFVVLDFPEKGDIALVDPKDDFDEHFDHIRPGIKVKTHHFYTK